MSLKLPKAKKQPLIVFSSIFSIAIIASGLFFAAQKTLNTHALSADRWRAGEIISDNNFTNSNSMSEEDIQRFLDSKLDCDLYGERPAYEYGSNEKRAVFARKIKGWPGPPYVCLNKYYEVPKFEAGGGMPASNFDNPTATPPAGSKSAAWIIKDAANRFNIDPKVLLVKIGTESAGPLTRDNWPMKSQYKYAMGSHCPDSGPNGSANCDQGYAGFSIQMYSAAALLRFYLDNNEKPWWKYKRPYQTQNILYNVVQTGCNGSDVYVKNKATAALYTYTPYQPNEAALNNMYGLGDRCSAYGNRNFWSTYWNWFGDPHVSGFENLSDPRLFQVKEATYKTNLTIHKDHEQDGKLPIGKVIKIVSKIRTTNDWCFRTEHDHNIDVPLCIPSSKLKEVDIAYQDLEEQEKEMTLIRDIRKTDYRRERDAGDMIGRGRIIKFSKKAIVNNKTYYVSEADYGKREIGIPTDLMRPASKYEKITPTWMSTNKNTNKTFVIDESNGPYLPKDLERIFTSKTFSSGIWYYRTETDERLKLDLGVSINDLTKKSFEEFVRPRWMLIKNDTQKVDPYTNQKNNLINSKTKLYFRSKITINGETYFRTREDTEQNSDFTIPAKDVAEIEFEDFARPRKLQLKANSKKYHLPEEITVGDTHETGLTRKFVAKMELNGNWYYQTEADHSSHSYTAFPAILLEEVPDDEPEE